MHGADYHFAMSFGGLSDGILWVIAGVVFLGAILWRDLVRAPRWVGPALIVVVGVGAALRLAISEDVLFTAWPYSRTVPLASAIAQGSVFRLLATIIGGEFFITDLIFNTNFFLAVLTPLALFAHANSMLKDPRAAVASAALLSLYPAHIAFSRSDVFFIQSLALSSLSFAAIYHALRGGSRTWVTLCTVALLPLLICTYGVRPLNAIFYPLFLATIFFTAGPGAPWARRWTVAGVATLAMAINIHQKLLAQSENISNGLGMNTLLNALSIAASPELNTLINPSITPVLFLFLAVLGVFWLFRSARRGIAIFLLVWLVSFFVAHSYIWPQSAMNQVRYHLHLAVPFLIMAGASAPLVSGWPKPVVALVVLAAAASPLIHLGFERDRDFGVLQEFEFLTTVRDKIPAGCHVLEFVGNSESPALRKSKIRRLSSRFKKGQWGTRWRVRPIAVPWENSDAMNRPENARFRPLSSVVDEVETSGECAYLYVGNLCWFFQYDISFSLSPCEQIKARFELEEVASKRFINRTYDSSAETAGIRLADAWQERHEEIPLNLYRIVGVRAPGGDAP